jgi:hypothetical protein
MTCFVRTLLVAMLATPWLPGTGVVQTTVQNNGVVGTITTTMTGHSVNTITTTVPGGVACLSPPVPGDDYATESLFPSEFPCLYFLGNSPDMTGLPQAKGASKPRCCPLCAKKASVQRLAREQPKRMVIPSAEWASGFTGETQVYVVQPFIGNLGSRETEQATNESKHCCPLCAKKMSVQIGSLHSRYSATADIGYFRPWPESESNNYVTQPLVGSTSPLSRSVNSLLAPPSWSIRVMASGRPEALDIKGDLGDAKWDGVGICMGITHWRITSVTTRFATDETIEFSAHGGHVVLAGDHVRAQAISASSGVRSSQIVLDGDVHLEYYKQDQRVDLKAGRIVLDLSDGSMKISPAAQEAEQTAEKMPPFRLSPDFVKTPLFGPWAN